MEERGNRNNDDHLEAVLNEEEKGVRDLKPGLGKATEVSKPKIGDSRPAPDAPKSHPQNKKKRKRRRSKGENKNQ